MADDKHSIRDRVIATLLAAFVIWLAARSWVQLKVLGSWVFHFFGSKSVVPNWLLSILVVLAAGLLLLAAARAWTNLMPRGSPQCATTELEPGWQLYRSDIFDGMKWEWRYASTGSTILSLYCLCPHDLTQLVFRQDYDKVSFICETCNKQFGPFRGNKEYVLSRIERQIIRKIRTGEWQTAAAHSGH